MVVCVAPNHAAAPAKRAGNWGLRQLRRSWVYTPVLLTVSAAAEVVWVGCTRFRSIKGHCARCACENGHAKTQLTLKKLSEFSSFFTRAIQHFPRMGVARLGEYLFVRR